jgi:hypothetical protein
MKQHRYTLRSDWYIEAPRKAVWRVLAEAPPNWSVWWPELQKLKNVDMKPKMIGSSFTTIWKSRGYTLRFRLRIIGVALQRTIAFESKGDLRGRAVMEFFDEGDDTHIQIVWRTTTTKLWMNRFYFIFKLFFVKNHNRVMKHGEQGLNHFLKTKP